MADSSEHPQTASALLETKLYLLGRRPGIVSRRRLLERLDRRGGRRLTLVSAPAGFGKSTLLAEWLAGAPAGESSAAWVSLDPGDNDPAVFWGYVLAALQRARPGIGEGGLAALRSAQPPPIEWLLARLINEVDAARGAVTLVLDDYHVIEAEPIHEAIAFLLEHLPTRMHLVIATRSDPPLPLARLRGRGELNELRASDLRFTPDEAAAFFQETMGLDLGASDVAALERRTEGWIAGLQLAALSMQGREDVPGFVSAFAGDDRYILDYLVEEVLQRQPARTREFVLQTSILDRLSGPLCDAVTGGADARRMLEALERDNLFVVPLDDKRHWFRYHQLFADVLRVHALDELPAQVTVLHGRASEWYEHNGFRSEAVHHALASGDFERAADLVERAGRAMLTRREDEAFLGWLRMLPDEVIRTRPVLSVYYALALVSTEPEAAEVRLQDAEALLDAAAEKAARAHEPSVEMTVADEQGFRSLPGTIAIVRAYRSGALGDVAGVVQHARRALDLLPADDHLWRGGAGGLLGLAQWASGDLEAAYRSFADAWASLRLTGDITQELSGAFVLAEIRAAQGRLREASRLYEQALERLDRHGGPAPPATADLYVGVSELHCERNDLEAAMQCLQRAEQAGEPRGISEHRHRWYVAMARVREAQGDLDGALGLLDEAERVYVPSPAPDTRPIAAMRARLWVRRGRLDQALDWVRERGLSVDDDLGYLREFEHLTLARALIAHYRSTGAGRSIRDTVRLLERLEATAEAGGRLGALVEVLALQALAHEAQGDIPAALVPLERALTLAEPEGYARIFLDEAGAMRTLLRHAAAEGIAGTYPRQLLSAFEEPGALGVTRDRAAGLAEPLTRRELEILRLIAAGMRNGEIAGHLVISEPTVKRHIANAYGKLGVSHRTAAVARASELKLL